jgi:hypothetical protein
MGCTLKAEGKDFSVDVFLEQSSLIPSRVFRKGEPEFPRTQPDGPVWDSSRVTIRICDRGFDNLQEQIESAILYLNSNEHEVERLCRFPGVEHVYLDFGIRQRDEAVECNYFPAELLSVAGGFGIGLELSQYAMSEETSRDV